MSFLYVIDASNPQRLASLMALRADLGAPDPSDATLRLAHQEAYDATLRECPVDALNRREMQLALLRVLDHDLGAYLVEIADTVKSNYTENPTPDTAEAAICVLQLLITLRANV